MLLRLIGIIDLRILDRLISNPSHDLVKSIGGSTICWLNPLVTNPSHHLMKSVGGLLLVDRLISSEIY